MAWTVRYTRTAQKSLSRLARPVADRIIAYMTGVSKADDPRLRGKALVGNLSGLCRYRIGKWRVICDISDKELVILALDVDNRSTVYGG